MSTRFRPTARRSRTTRRPLQRTKKLNRYSTDNNAPKAQSILSTRGNALINRERLDSVRKKYGHYASWAVWGAEGLTPKSGMGDISFFEDPREELLATLNPEVILVGLNISRPIQRPFGNFHPDYPEAQDYKLRHALYETGFWGGYLTDIIKDFEEKVSGKMMAYLRQDPDFEQRQDLPRGDRRNRIRLANPDRAW